MDLISIELTLDAGTYEDQAVFIQGRSIIPDYENLLHHHLTIHMTTTYPRVRLLYDHPGFRVIERTQEDTIK